MKYLVEVHVGGKRYQKQYYSTYRKSTDKAYAYARKVSRKHGKPWTFLHNSKVETKKKKGGLPF